MPSLFATGLLGFLYGASPSFGSIQSWGPPLVNPWAPQTPRPFSQLHSPFNFPSQVFGGFGASSFSSNPFSQFLHPRPAPASAPPAPEPKPASQAPPPPSSQPPAQAPPPPTPQTPKSNSKPRTCKPTAISPNWPSPAEWSALNNTLKGALLAPSPPAQACHVPSSSFSASDCAAVADAWSNSWSFHLDDPVSVAYNNWNNDTCLPDPAAPCSELGYPAYVVNATSAEAVAQGVRFAKSKGVRLVVKATPHDFRGRTAAPHALSIWTRHIRGVEVHSEGFVPAGCARKAWWRPRGAEPAASPAPRNNAANAMYGPAVTVAAGETHFDAFAAAAKHGLMINVAGGASVGYGGYVSGGGHGLLSAKYGMAADNVLQMTVVKPDGKIVVANECDNEDLFWAMRGGGGGTFGVATDITLRAWPSVRMVEHPIVVREKGEETGKIFDAMALMLKRSKEMAERDMMAYMMLEPQADESSSIFKYALEGIGQGATDTEPVLKEFEAAIEKAWPGVFNVSIEGPLEYDSVFDYWQNNLDDSTPVGLDMVIGSRLLDQKALSKPDLADYLRNAMSMMGMQLVIAAGPGVHKRDSDFNALHPAWREAYVHVLVGEIFPPLDVEAKTEAIKTLTQGSTESLRQLAPNTGSYLNEANAFEPNWQRTFYGSNYQRLLKIKRSVDPTSVFWCRACVGSEAWEEVGDELCKTAEDNGSNNSKLREEKEKPGRSHDYKSKLKVEKKKPWWFDDDDDDDDWEDEDCEPDFWHSRIPSKFNHNRWY